MTEIKSIENLGSLATGSQAWPMRPIDWFGLDPTAWSHSPDREASVALWRLDSDAAVGLKTDPIIDTHLICVHLAGSMNWSAKTNDRRYDAPCEANTLCIARAGETADVEFSNAHLSFAHFYLPVRWFESDMVDAASSRCGKNIELIDPMNSICFKVSGLARKVVGTMRSGGPASRLRIDAALIELAALLVKHHSTANSARIARGGLAPFVVRRVVDYLEAHLADAVALADLANLAGLSAPHFCRAFAESTGLAPHRYQIAMRIERATQLLANPKNSIADVAIAVGYDDPAYFSRLFANQTGLSPRSWRASVASR